MSQRVAWSALLLAAALIHPVAAQPNPDAPGLALPDGKIQLRLQPKPGDTYNLRLSSSFKSASTIRGFSLDASPLLVFDLTFKVARLDEKGRVYTETTFHPNEMQIQIGEFKSAFKAGDAGQPAKNDPISKVLRAMDGMVLTVQQSPTGRTENVVGLDEWWERAAAQKAFGDAAGPPNAMAAGKNFFKQMYGIDTMQSLGNVFGTFPEKPIGIGESWTNTFEGATGKTTVISTLKSRRDGRATILFSTSLQMEPTTPKAEAAAGAPAAGEDKPAANRFEMKMTSTINSQGSYEIDERTGLLHYARYDVLGLNQMTMITRDMPEGLTWPLYLAGSIEMKRDPAPHDAAKVD